MLKQFKRIQRLVRPHLHNLAHLPQRVMRRNTVRAYWSNLDVNFGDAITPLLLSHYGLTPICVAPERAQLASTGSILHHLPSQFSGYILGSGLISEEYAKPYANATILALRGALTRDLLQASKTLALGDPGLLLPQILPKLPKKQTLVGIVPHFVDKQNVQLQILCARFPTQIRVIDVQRHPLSVLEDMAQCEYILSSSLHGLVVADALGTPNAWLVLSDKVKGGSFKFRDYYSAFDCTHEPHELSGHEELHELIDLAHVPPVKVSSVQEDLDELFRDLPRLLS